MNLKSCLPPSIAFLGLFAASLQAQEYHWIGPDGGDWLNSEHWRVYKGSWITELPEYPGEVIIANGNGVRLSDTVPYLPIATHVGINGGSSLEVTESAVFQSDTMDIGLGQEGRGSVWIDRAAALSIRDQLRLGSGGEQPVLNITGMARVNVGELETLYSSNSHLRISGFLSDLSIARSEGVPMANRMTISDGANVTVDQGRGVLRLGADSGAALRIGEGAGGGHINASQVVIEGAASLLHFDHAWNQYYFETPFSVETVRQSGTGATVLAASGSEVDHIEVLGGSLRPANSLNVSSVTVRGSDNWQDTTLFVQDGVSITSASTVIGGGIGAVELQGAGLISIEGAGSVMNGGTVTIGDVGRAEISASNGGRFEAASVILGGEGAQLYNSGASGTLTVSGSESRLKVSGELLSGKGSTGWLHLTEGAEGDIGSLKAGEGVFASSHNGVSNGAKLQVGHVVLGEYGNGLLDINGGGSVVALSLIGGVGTSEVNDPLQDDRPIQINSRGGIVVSGAESRLTVAAGATLGVEGHGDLHIEHGGRVEISAADSSSAALTMAREFGSTANAFIHGAGSELILHGNLDSAGDVTVRAGARLQGDNAVLRDRFSLHASGANSRMELNDIVLSGSGGGMIAVDQGAELQATRIHNAAIPTRLITQVVIGGTTTATAAGHLDIASISTEGDTQTDLVFHHTAEDYAFTNGLSEGIALSGTINIIHSGPGSTRLLSARSGVLNSGTTLISAGTLILESPSAIGSGSVTLTGGRLEVEGLLGREIALSGGSYQQRLEGGVDLAQVLHARSSTAADATEARFLAGELSNARDIAVAFSQQGDALNEWQRRSDILTLTGLDGELFVLEIEAVEVSEVSFLGWFNEASQRWVNAVEGNSQSDSFFAGDIAFDLSDHFTLGTWGIDTTKGSVWAVLDHNSAFAVVIPEPTLTLFVGIGALWLAVGRRRRL